MRRYPCLEEDLRTAIEGRLFFFPHFITLDETESKRTFTLAN